MYVVKPYSDTQLLVAVQMAFHIAFKKENIDRDSRLALTKREREIAQLVADGLASKQIAQKLHISIETEKTHRKHLLPKNNIGNKSEEQKSKLQSLIRTSYAVISLKTQK